MHVLLALLLAASPDAGVSPSLPVSGAFITAASLDKAALEALTPVTKTWRDKKGEHQVKGVRLDAVLLKLGYSEGASGPKVNPVEKHAGLRAAVVARAADGFEAVFSVGELLATLGKTEALVVWEQDGAPLSDTMGPFRIVVTTDALPSRSIYQLRSLEVVDLRKR
ncbi:MAG: molybdopterin-dependent oxidoreductase [Myxococcaceae bacterium]|jgi:hypothetical protein|nr:molybdopterin-dependent oxidoreductase [Myxococcaceae bacterium]